MTSYRLKHRHLKLFKVTDRLIINILYAVIIIIIINVGNNSTQGDKQSSSWRFSPSFMGLAASLLHPK